MATQVQFRRGTTAETSVFIGADGEVTVDTTKKTCVVHDGFQVSGYPLLREDGSNSAFLPGGLSSCALKFVGDPNTGIFSPGSDQIGLVTGGVSRLLIDSSGSVTIPGNVLVGGTVSGAITFDDGSAAVPAIRFTNDPNTGIYRPGTDQVAISTNGTGRLFVDASGNVGIGINSPSYLLHVVKNSNDSQPTAIIANSSSLGSAATYFAVTSDSSQSAGLTVTSSTWGNYGLFKTQSAVLDAGGTASTVLGIAGQAGILFGVGANPYSEVMRIDSSGQLGLGTSSPSGLFDARGLSYLSGAQIRDSSHVAKGYVQGDARGFLLATDGSTNIVFDVNGTERVRLDTSGRLGIGTTSPGSLLDLRSASAPSLHISTTGYTPDYRGYSIDLSRAQQTGGINFTASSPSVFLDLYAGGSAANLGGWDGQIRFFTGGTDAYGTERARIDSSGRLGVGTSSPGELLDVYGGSLQVGSHYVSTVDTNYRIRLRSVGGAANNNYTGEIGLAGGGVQPAESSMTFATQTWNGSSYVVSEKVRITSAGNVGIGTTSPARALDVNGSIQLPPNNALYINGSNNYLYADTAATELASSTLIKFVASGAERARIDSSGRLLVGTSTARGNFFNGAVSAALQLEGTGTNRRAAIIGDDFEGSLILASQKSGAVGGNTVLASGDPIGAVSFQGNDGSEFVEAATITAQVDGTPGANDMPGRLVFSTTADGASSPTERMRITSAGLVGLGTSSPGTILDVRFGTSPITDNGAGSNALRSFTTSALAVNTGGAISLGGVYHNNGDVAAFGQIAGRKENSTSNDLSGYLQFATNTGGGTMVERARIDSAGRLGIGTSSPGYLLDVASSVLQVGNATDAFIQYKSSAGNWHAGAVNSNAYAFYSGTYGSGIERARIDSSGRLLVGTSTARSNFLNSTVDAQVQIERSGEGTGELSLVRNVASTSGPLLLFGKSRGATVGSNTIVNSGDQLGWISFGGSDGTEFVQGASIIAEVDGTPGANDMPGRLVFSTTADGASGTTERMRINAAGALKASTNGTYLSASDASHEIVQSTGSALGLSLYASSTSYTGSVLGISCNRNTTNNTYYFIDVSVYGVAYRFRVADSGDVTNTNNSYGAISDRKLKENIVDAASQWNDIKALQVRKYNFKEETGQPTHAQIGLIAQEVELVSPGLVSESLDRDAEGNDLDTTTKSVNYSVLYMKAVKALQEAMERIETLEAKVTALEAS
jgi:hypothetical protein